LDEKSCDYFLAAANNEITTFDKRYLAAKKDVVEKCIKRGGRAHIFINTSM